MNINELMIGDWYCWEAEGKTYNFQVTGETFSLNQYDISNFIPMKITENIMDKNFKILYADAANDEWLMGGDEESTHFQIWHNKFLDTYKVYIIQPTKNDHGYNLISTTEVITHTEVKDIKYVHELQHLLKVFNIDNDIVMP